jgi:hypothetical protein
MTQVDQIAHKRTKTPFRLVPLAFVAEMAHVMAAGLKVPGRYVDSWKQLDPAELPMYLEGIQRHLQAEEEAGPLAIDPDTNKPHLVHIACGAMIAWWLARSLRGVQGAECTPVFKVAVDPDALPVGWGWDAACIGSRLYRCASERAASIYIGCAYAVDGDRVGEGGAWCLYGYDDNRRVARRTGGKRALLAAARERYGV